MSIAVSLAPQHRPGPLSADAPAGTPALVGATGASLSYGHLRELVHDHVRRLPDPAAGRCLVHVPLRPDPASVVAYLATIEAGHVALVTGDDSRAEAVLERYRPDLAATGDRRDPYARLASLPQHLLHPDLALLLSTSGSTGSPKLVRLSRENVRCNATAIAEALRITPADRGITSLPLHYTFGLSVLHSHLVAGASVVLHEGSVLDDGFWTAVDRWGVTNLAAVPHTVELMESIGALERPHPALRLVAQAGGRMHPDRVRRTAAIGSEHGWGLSVMYGQTEATARICVLPPELVADHPDAVGHPVAGTTIHLDTTVPEAGNGTGEVVVRGPGVMMGYAEHPDDLALGALLDELRTGDLGRISPEGMLRLVGRRAGFVKVMGLRIDLARVEDALETAGFTTCVGGDDTGLTIAVEPVAGRSADRTAQRVRDLAGRAGGLGPASIAVAVVELARRSNGKVDRAGCAALVKAAVATGVARTARASLATEVARVIGRVLGTDGVDLDRSFVQLGGDSLSHVQASSRLEGLLGPLPRDWHHCPLRELAAAADPTDAPVTRRAERAPRRGQAWRSVETSVLLRAIAVVIICASHADLLDLMGGAHILLAVTGFNAARFGLSFPAAAGRWRSAARMLIGVAVPTMAVALFGMAATGRYGWTNVTMTQWLFGAPTDGPTRHEFWFIEALVASIVVITAVLSIPAVGRAWRGHPWRVAAVLTAVALVPRFVIPPLWDGPVEAVMPTTFWLFALGAAAAYADTRARRLATLGLAVIGTATFFPDDPARNAVILGGVVLLTLVARIRVPAPILPVVSLLAAASLYVYLVQFLVLSMFENNWVETLSAIAVGCLVWGLADRPVRRLQDLVPPPDR